ncbi:MAG TPA: hypothetical protein VK206_27890 [Anaerolineales bacterium]|nr:hypothetical protein [Anaerolineales bacterium]
MLNFRRYSNLFVLWTVQGFIALVWLLLIPTDSGSYSTPRIFLIGLLVSIILASVVLVYKSRLSSGPVFSSHRLLYQVIYFLALLALLLSPIVIAALSALGRTVSFTYTAFAERLAPLAFWASLSGLEWCLWHIFAQKRDLSGIRPLLASTFKILFVFAIVGIIIFLTGWGVVPIKDGSFGGPPTPLLEWQIILAVLLGATALLAESHWKLKQLDLILFFLVYLFTCLFWLSDPLIPGFFATPPRAPNFEPYPFSDPLIYAQYSQSALVGNGFLWPDIPTRPFYVMLLTWMHALMGQNYYHVIILQTILLAFFPATLYLLGQGLNSRPMGLMLALLAALRDMTANHSAPFASNYSYSKLFLSEIPAALFLVIFTILIIRWIKGPKPMWFFLITGGVLGIASLIRLQSVVLLAPVTVTTIFPLWKTRRVEWLRGLLLLTLGVVLAFSPWLLRNYYAGGGLIFDNPISQSMVLARRWSGDNGNTLIPQLPDETTAQYVRRLNAIAIDSFKREPGRILNGVAHHFFNNLISSIYILPMRDRLESPIELLWPQHAFWQTRARSPLLTTFYVILLALGLATAWTFHRWIGLLPFLLSLAYHAWTALFLSSGSRFLLPIDWTWCLYYALGLLALSKLALSGIHDIQWAPAFYEDKIHSSEAKRSEWWKIALAAGLVLFVGASLPLTELVFPQKYPLRTQEQLSKAFAVPLLKDELVFYGRAIYPRYYGAGEGEPETAKLGYAPSKEARLVFYLVGPKAGLVVFPLENAPVFFPQASDVWIIGRWDGDVLRARIVKVEEDEKSVIYRQ